MKNLIPLLCLFPLVLTLNGAEKKESAAEKKLPIQEVSYPCSFDQSEQKALVYFAQGKAPRPLVVALHTWSFTYAKAKNYVPHAIRYNCHLIAPDFRGKNSVGNPLSMGSDAAVADIVSAVEWMKKKCAVDPDRIYLTGGSGGGFMALLMAGRHPEIWAGVSAWCPISDLKAWCTFHKGKGYGSQIIRNLKGDPRTDAAAAAEAAKRSPLTYLARANGLALDIATGIHDGHKGSVPISEALNAYNTVVPAQDRVPEADIRFMVENEKAPEGTPEFNDPAFGKRKIHYRKTSGNTRVTIIEGGHIILPGTAFAWLMKQRKGKPAVWEIGKSSGKAEELTK